MIISVKEARRILGCSVSTMRDEEIKGLIETLGVIATEALKDAQRRRIKEDSDNVDAFPKNKKDVPPINPDNRCEKEYTD